MFFTSHSLIYTDWG